MDLNCKYILCSMIIGETKTLNYRNLDKINFLGYDLELFQAIKYSIQNKGYVDQEVIVAKVPHLEKYLFDVLDVSVGGENLQEFIDSVYNKQLKIRLKTLMNKKIGSNVESEILDITKELQQMIKETCDSEDYNKKGVELFKEILDELDSEIEETDVFETGYSDLDELINLSPGDLWLIAARASMGKSVFMMNLAKNFAKKNKKVKVLSLEMTSVSLQKRVVSCISGVNLNKLVNKRNMKFLTSEDKDNICKVNTIADYVLANIDYFDKAGATIDEVETQIKLASEQGCEVVFIDYAQFISSSKQYQSETLRIADIVKRIKVCGRDNNILVVMLAQVNRGVEGRADRRPMMSDLDGSSELEKTSDIISFIYRDDYYNDDSQYKGLMEIITRKQRNGGLGTVFLRFFGDIQRITNYSSKVD
ncbi:replicative DNA helicase [Cetobacterium sp.]|uniref:replicative DNA helicase n=1 Tax=Cetobacterium sp. TaxID=2071632 RepID=UPI003F2BEEE8